MIRRNPRGDRPESDESAFIDPTAIICGKVVVEADRDGQMEPIAIGQGSNIQDGVVIHSKPGPAVTIGNEF